MITEIADHRIGKLVKISVTRHMSLRLFNVGGPHDVITYEYVNFIPRALYGVVSMSLYGRKGRHHNGTTIIGWGVDIVAVACLHEGMLSHMVFAMDELEIL